MNIEKLWAEMGHLVTEYSTTNIFNCITAREALCLYASDGDAMDHFDGELLASWVHAAAFHKTDRIELVARMVKESSDHLITEHGESILQALKEHQQTLIANADWEQ